MKGVIKNKEGKWVVEYNKSTSHNTIHPKQLPLHPDSIQEDAMLYPDGYVDEKEVEFEIVNLYVTTKECLCKDLSYEEIKPCEHFTGAPINECLYMEQEKVQYAKLITKQEESSNWDEIWMEFYDLYNAHKIDINTPFYKWLKEHYNPPVKR